MGKRKKWVNEEAPQKAAHAAGLRYVSDISPGIRRLGKKTFRYQKSRGGIIRDIATLRRIRALAIPPAWRDVWICANPNGHLQATGRDDRGRKQHRYHQRWREVRDETKFTRMVQFARALPGIRARTRRDLARPGLSREKVLATIVRLLEASLIRVGNDEYARHNNSFGLTTLQDRHVDVTGGKIHFQFRGKSGKTHSVAVQNRRLAKIVKKCQDIPGQDLFQYYDEQERRHDVTSGDVNDYLREICGQNFTAKDFRTWAGTVLASTALLKFTKCNSQTQAKKNLGRAIEWVATRLGNTPAICRKCYVHPAIFDSYLDGSMRRGLKKPATPSAPGRLRPEEAAVLSLLQRRHAQGKEPLTSVLKRSLVQVRKKRSRRQFVTQAPIRHHGR